MARNHFAQWVQDQLDMRGWRQADLARASGLSSSLISQILADHRKGLHHPPAESTIQGLAKAFNVTRDEVLIQAGKALGIPTGAVVSTDPRNITDEALIGEFVRRFNQYRDAAGPSLTVVPDTLAAVADDRPDDMTSEVEEQQLDP